MKFLPVFTALLVATAFVPAPAIAQGADKSDQAPPTPIKPATERSWVCYRRCPSGQYCENGTNYCRSPFQYGECFNPATGRFQFGCDPGFECVNNKCAFA